MKRYQAPAADGAMLIDPPFEQVSSLFHSSKQTIQSGKSIGELSLSEFRAKARQEVLALSREYHIKLGESVNIEDSEVWFLAGHQSEFFHPGVWLKNFVLSRLGRDHRAVSLNLIVDNDIAKATSIRVPRDDGSLAIIPFDSSPAEMPMEEWQVRDEGVFQSFPNRLDDVTHHWNERPMAFRFWEKATENSRRAPIDNRLPAIRRHFERQWAAVNLELPVSQLSSTRSFGVFVRAIIQDADRFAMLHNDALREYRRRHRIKSRLHPVPELARDDSWQEVPFWIWSKADPKRRRAFIRHQGAQWEFRWGDGAKQWNDPNIKIRPRALTLTMFARLALADLFIHGIGGAKYDEVTDVIAARFFNVALPPFMVVSGTLRLPLQPYPATIVDLQAARRHERELKWNPHRPLGAGNPELAAQRERLLALPIQTHRQRRERCLRLRENLEHWQPLTHWELALVQAEIDRLTQELRSNEVIHAREYPYILFSEHRLRTWFDQVTSA